MTGEALSPRRRLLFLCVGVAILWSFTELVCLGGLWALRRYKDLVYAPEQLDDLSERHRSVLESYLAGTPSYLVYSSTLGWTIGPHATNPGYHANGQGLRADHEYAATPPVGRLRIAAFGDSFTHSSDVPDDATWEVRLEQLDPTLEVMNFGVPGYGVDQAYLRYRELGVGFQPRVVLIGFMSDNINRVVNVFRPFVFYQSGVPFAKPRFVLRGGGLALIPNPIRSLQGYRDLLAHPEETLAGLGRDDFFYQRNNQRSRFDFLPSVRFARVLRERATEPIFKDEVFNPGSEAYQLSAAIVDRFHAEVLAHGAIPIVVLFPGKEDVRRFRDEGKRTYEPLLRHVESRGYRHLDILDGFARYGADDELKELVHVHYTRHGCTLVAQAIHDYLVAQGLVAPRPASADRAAAAGGGGAPRGR